MKDLVLSDFRGYDVARFIHLASKSWTKLELLRLMDLYAIHYLVKKNILVVNKSESTGLPFYTVRDGFIDG